MPEQQSSPLEGLTEQQADQAIAAFAAKVEQAEEHLKAAKAHLKELKAARKTLREPGPTGDGVIADAQAATLTVEGSDAG